jgi:hypothetical protein
MGFSAREADRLVALKLRYVRGEFPAPTLEVKRLHFVRWLVEHGRLSEAVPNPQVDQQRPLRAA